MRNLWLIIRREYVSRGKSSAYMISTLFMMVMLLASTLAPAIVASKEKTDPLHVLLLDKTGQVTAPLQAMLESGMGLEDNKRQLTLEVATGTEEELLERARGENIAVLIVEGTFPSAVKARFYSRAMKELQKSGSVMGPLNALVRSARMQERGINPAVAMEILQPMEVEERQLSATGKDERDAKDFFGSMTAALGVVMAIYITVLMNGTFVFQGVLEEKVSRVMEVMLSSVRPGQMMAGKVLGLGALGLTQFALLGAAWFAGKTAAGQILADAAAQPQSIGLGVGLLALLFMVLGYAISATMMAAAAATISRMEDSQALMMPLSMIQAIPVMVIVPIMTDPNGALAVAFSFIPFFAPSVMAARVILGDVPTWQVALSTGLMVATAVLMTWAGGRIYRAAMLSYGGRPSMKQLWSYLRAG